MNNKQKLCRCIRPNSREFRVGTFYPYEVIGSRIVVDDPPCYDWSFNSKSEFEKYFRVGGTL